jgi:hypothetical protein
MDFVIAMFEYQSDSTRDCKEQVTSERHYHSRRGHLTSTAQHVTFRTRTTVIPWKSTKVFHDYRIGSKRHPKAMVEELRIIGTKHTQMDANGCSTKTLQGLISLANYPWITHTWQWTIQHLSRCIVYDFPTKAPFSSGISIINRRWKKPEASPSHLAIASRCPRSKSPSTLTPMGCQDLHPQVVDVGFINEQKLILSMNKSWQKLTRIFQWIGLTENLQ